MIALAYAACTLIWGSTWMAIKFGLDGVPPFLGASLRFLLAAAVLWLLVLAGGRGARLSPSGRKAALSATILGFFINYALVYWAETRVHSGLVAVLFSLAPILTAFAAAALGVDRPTPAHLAGAAVGAVGVAVLMKPEAGAAGADPAGILAAFLAVVASAFNLVLQTRWARGEDARALNAWGMTAGGLLLGVLSLAVERGTVVAWDARNLAALLYLSMAGSVVAFLLYYRLIRELAPTRVSLMTLLFPVVALFLGRVVAGEQITVRAALGSALILAGVGGALLAPRRR